MPFTKTNWVQNALPADTAAQKNRIEQALADLFAYKGAKRKLDFNATQWDVTGLDGATHKGYDITAWGLYATGTDNSPFLNILTPAGNYYKSEMIETAVTTADVASL